MKLCSFPDCGRPLNAKGLCDSHYRQQRTGQALRPIGNSGRRVKNLPCSFEDCGRHALRFGLCNAHREQELRGEALRPIRAGRQFCTVEGCDRLSESRGHCSSHANQRRKGQPVRPLHVPTYRYQSSDGYIRLLDPSHPNAATNGLVMEHVKVMSEALGRPLVGTENVHHVNGVRDDNRLANLELWDTSQPKGQRIEDKVEFALDLLRRYRPGALRSDTTHERVLT